MQQRRKRYQTGSVVLDPRTQTWFFRWYEGKTRKAERIGSTKQYRTKTEAMRAAEGMRLRINSTKPFPTATVEQVVMRFLAERMPERHKTSREYRSILEGKIIPTWGAKEMPLQPYDVKLWLDGLRFLKTGQPLSPKTKSHVKHMLHAIHESAMLWGIIPVGQPHVPCPCQGRWNKTEGTNDSDDGRVPQAACGSQERALQNNGSSGGLPRLADQRSARLALAGLRLASCGSQNRARRGCGQDGCREDAIVTQAIAARHGYRDRP